MSTEELIKMERAFGILPKTYKELLLTTNGCYLFDLINIAGNQEGYKGLSHEEMVNQPIPLKSIIPSPLRKRTDDKGLFVFATSMVNDSFYAIDNNERVLEIKFIEIKPIQEFNSIKDLLNEIFIQGKTMVESGEFIDFY